MKKILILMFVGLVIFSSGCVNLPWGKTSAPTTYGVVVNSFEPDFSEVESGDDVDLYLEIENNGGSKAEDVTAFLYNLGDLNNGQELSDNPYEFGSLEPPDESANLPGDIGTKTWTLTAPELPKGVTQVYSPRVRLFYKYHTIASTDITVLTKSEYKRLKEKNQLPEATPTTSITKGPLSITISAREPVIYESGTREKFDVFITVGLIGQGSVFSPDADYSNGEVSSDELDKIKIKIDTDGATSASTGSCDILNSFQEKTMRRGQSLTYSCELKPNTFTTRTMIPIRVTLYYGYLQDYSTSLTVRGTGEESTSETTTTTVETTTTTSSTTTTTA